MWKKNFFATLIVTFLISINCTREEHEEKDIIASVGDRSITTTDFVRRVELSPLPSWIDISTSKGKQDALDLLIAEKLFANVADSLGLDADPIFQKKIESIEASSVGRELYRDVVRKEVEVGEDEITDAVMKMGQTLVVHFVQARELDVAQTWKQRLDGGLSFDELLEDITGDSPSPEDNRIEFSWGKTEPQIEEVAYQMHVGDVSPVIPVSNGYIILELENRIQELLPTAAHSAARRSTAGKIIRRRKEAVRSGQFVEEFMRDKNVVLKRIPFSILISELEEWVEFDEENRNQPRIKFFIHREVNLVEDRLNEHLDDILVEFTGGGWTIRDFLEKLWLNEIPLSRETRRHFRRGLQESIRILVRDALLAKEGYRRGLDLRTSVKYDVGIWKDYFLSVLYSNQLKKENADIGERFRMLREKYGIIVNEEQLERIELTTIPMVAVWTDLQRQLVVPLWPLLEETSH